MLKQCENPPLLHPPVGSIRELVGPWWVVHTKPRTEKALAWDLVQNDVPFFLPLVKRTLYGGGRKRHSMVPLFPSYLFVVAQDEGRIDLMQNKRACNVIAVPDQNRLLNELSAIELAINQQVQIDLCPQAVVGKTMRVTRGPFRDIVGTVIRRDTVMRLVMQVSILGRAVEMDIEAELLEPAE